MSLVAQTVKNLPALQKTWVRSLGWEDPLEKGMATHSSFPAWKNSMDRGAWQTTVHGVPVYRVWGFKETDVTKRIRHTILKIFRKYNQ